MESLHQICILLIVFLSTSIVNAQDNDSIKTQPLKQKSYITFNLLTPFDILVPRLRLGYIQSINQHWKVGLELGYGNKQLAFADFNDDNKADYQLWEIRPEVYYFISPWKQHERYFSTELFYINHKDVFYGKPQFDQADYQRHKYGFHLKYGMIFRVSKHLGLNFYTGFGLRIRSNDYSNEINPVDVKDLRDFHPDGYKDFEGVKTGVDFSLGLKLVVF